MKILPVVEGYGDAQAVPFLIRSTLYSHDIFDTEPSKPYRLGELRGVMNNLDRLYHLVGAENQPILWVLDCDDGCAVEHVTELRQRSNAHSHLPPVEFALVVREFESLFLAEKEALRSELPRISNDIFSINPEQPRSVKETITRHLPAGESYKPTVHQGAITARLDIGSLRANSGSFRHFERALLRLRTRASAN